MACVFSFLEHLHGASEAGGPLITSLRQPSVLRALLAHPHQLPGTGKVLLRP